MSSVSSVSSVRRVSRWVVSSYLYIQTYIHRRTKHVHNLGVEMRVW